MANCPKCLGEMKQMEAICPHCGYNFPVEDIRKRWGLQPLTVWMKIGDGILLLAALCSFVTAGFCSMMLFGAVMTQSHPRLWGTTIHSLVAVIALIQSLAMMIICLRLQSSEKIGP